MLTISSVDWNAMIALFFYPFVRIMAWLSMDPLLGNKAAPNSVRVALAFILALVIGPVPFLPSPRWPWSPVTAS